MRQELVIPDGVQPIRAYRAWRRSSPNHTWPEMRGGRWLYPAAVGFGAWSAVQAAACLRFRTFLSGDLPDWRHDDEGVPGEHCICGLYACATIEHVMGEVSFCNEPAAYGEVDLWGRIVEHEWGYRAQYAKIVKLYDTDPEIGAYAANYGVDVCEAPRALLRHIFNGDCRYCIRSRSFEESFGRFLARGYC